VQGATEAARKDDQGERTTRVAEAVGKQWIREQAARAHQEMVKVDCDCVCVRVCVCDCDRACVMCVCVIFYDLVCLCDSV